MQWYQEKIRRSNAEVDALSSTVIRSILGKPSKQIVHPIQYLHAKRKHRSHQPAAVMLHQVMLDVT